MKISKMFLLLVTGVFYSSLVFANPTEVFCQQYISTKSNADKTKKPSSWESFGIGFRWEFNRKSFVRPYVIGDTTAIPKTNESEPFSPEILVVGQPNRISSTQKEFIDTYNAFLALKNKLVDELKVVNDQDSCVKTVSAESVLSALDRHSLDMKLR